jgi:hypothetical protein
MISDLFNNILSLWRKNDIECAGRLSLLVKHTAVENIFEGPTLSCVTEERGEAIGEFSQYKETVT